MADSQLGVSNEDLPNSLCLYWRDLEGVTEAALYCALLSHPPNPERAETRSCPRRALSECARSASKKGTWPLLTPLRHSTLLSPMEYRSACTSPTGLCEKARGSSR